MVTWTMKKSKKNQIEAFSRPKKGGELKNHPVYGAQSVRANVIFVVSNACIVQSVGSISVRQQVDVFTVTRTGRGDFEFR